MLSQPATDSRWVFLSVSQQFCVRLCLCLSVVGDLSKDVSVIDGVVSSLCPGKDHGQRQARSQQVRAVSLLPLELCIELFSVYATWLACTRWVSDVPLVVVLTGSAN
jgi:hypothetical protein